MSGEPTYLYRPDFTPSSVDCVLPSGFVESRARLWVGGIYIRTYNVGLKVNVYKIKAITEYQNPSTMRNEATNISGLIERVNFIATDTTRIEQTFSPVVVVTQQAQNRIVLEGDHTSLLHKVLDLSNTLTLANGLYFIMHTDYSIVDDETTLYTDKVLTSDFFQVTIAELYTEHYVADQVQLSIGPINPCDEWDSGIPNIRSQIQANQHSLMTIQAPNRPSECDNSIAYEDVVDAEGELVDGYSLTSFDFTDLNNATGVSLDPSIISSIRTGPDRTLLAINSTEYIDSHPLKGDGLQIIPPASERVLQWDGTEWITYTPFS